MLYQKRYMFDPMNDRTYRSTLNTDEKALIALVRAAEVFKRAHGGVFRKYGLSFPQYNVLRVLEASRKGRSRISDVSRIMIVPGANMTGLAKRLEKRGFITKKSDPGDERVTILEITPKGKKVLRGIKKDKDEWLEAMLRGFSDIEKLNLLDIARRLIKANIQTRPEPGTSPLQQASP